MAEEKHRETLMHLQKYIAYPKFFLGFFFLCSKEQVFFF